MYKIKGFPVEGKIALGEPVMIINGNTNVGSIYFLESINEETGKAKILKNKSYSYSIETNIDNLAPARLYLCSSEAVVGDTVYKVKNQFTTSYPIETYTLEHIEKGVNLSYDRYYTGPEESKVFIGNRDQFLIILGEASTQSSVDDGDMVDEKRAMPFIKHNGKLYSMNVKPFFDANVDLKKEYTIFYKIACNSCKHFH